MIIGMYHHRHLTYNCTDKITDTVTSQRYYIFNSIKIASLHKDKHLHICFLCIATISLTLWYASLSSIKAVSLLGLYIYES